jgi:predicted transcriptional regulator
MTKNLTAKRRTSPRQVSVRLPDPLARRLRVAARVLQQSQSQLVTTGMTEWLERLPAATRRIVDGILALQRKG